MEWWARACRGSGQCAERGEWTGESGVGVVHMCNSYRSLQNMQVLNTTREWNFQSSVSNGHSAEAHVCPGGGLVVLDGSAS